MTETEKKLAERLYSKILQTANMFITNARAYEISVLQKTNPSYEEIAQIMLEMAELVSQLIDEIDPMMAQKANEYVYYMNKMGIAIHQGDSIELSTIVKKLESKPFC